MRINFGKYILDINVEENEKYYKNERYISEGCECDGCRNYELAVEKVSSEVREIFEQLGLDIKKPTEVYVNCSEDNILFYGDFIIYVEQSLRVSRHGKLYQKQKLPQ